MSEPVDAFVSKIFKIDEIVNRTEKIKIIEEATELIYGNPNRDEVKVVVSALINVFIGGYNAYKNVDEFLSRQMPKEWGQAMVSVFGDGSNGWSACVKQLLDDLKTEAKE